MKSFVQFIQEAIKRLPKNKSGIIVFDIDDTLLKANPEVIKVYKKQNGKEIELSTEDFAKDPDAGIKEKNHLFDFRDFHNPIKVYNSIISGTPLIKNLKIMDSYIEAGYDFCFLTARGAEETVKKALKDFLKIADRKTGALRDFGSEFK